MSQHINITKHDGYAIITMAKEPVNRWVLLQNVPVICRLACTTHHPADMGATIGVQAHRTCKAQLAYAAASCYHAFGIGVTNAEAQPACAADSPARAQNTTVHRHTTCARAQPLPVDNIMCLLCLRS